MDVNNTKQMKMQAWNDWDHNKNKGSYSILQLKIEEKHSVSF